ncbi:hypothetical protein QFZ51_004435 [Chitinophaga sp. W3I9]|uniref:hypothetical protein n=1 Tax=Chitinophaga sp. W3I9 TaxID=3373924 RepID=UPI003D1B4805
MNIITDYKNRQLFLSRDDDEGTAPQWYDTINERIQLWEQYPGYSVVAWHPGNRLLVLNSPLIIGSRKLVSRLVVMNIDTQKELYSTSRHLYYNAFFNGAGTHILLEAYSQKPSWVDIATGEIVAVVPFGLRLADGTYDPFQDVFYFPMEKQKAYIRVDGADFTCTKVKTFYPDLVSKITWWNGQYLILTQGNILFCCDQQFQPLWQRSFSDLGGDSGQVHGTDILVTEDDELICLSASASETNGWGVAYVLDRKIGAVRNIIQGERGRGRITGAYFHHQVFLYTMKLLDLNTGAVHDFLPGFK